MNQITPNALYELDLGGTLKLVSLCRAQLRWSGLQQFELFPLTFSLCTRLVALCTRLTIYMDSILLVGFEDQLTSLGCMSRAMQCTHI